MQNIEIKYKIKHPKTLKKQLNLLDSVHWEFRKKQRDIYFRTPNGRLKIRIQDETPAHLIEYFRPDAANPRVSDYHISPVENVAATVADLSEKHGILAEVVKQRDLYWYKNVRIHLDKVAVLGWFLEFESVISEKCARLEAEKNLSEIVEMLSEFLDQPQSLGYLELLNCESNEPLK